MGGLRNPPGAPDRDEGFTLVELLVVVIVVGVLAAVALPVFAAQRDSARSAATRSDLAHAKQAIVGYRIEHGDAVPPGISDSPEGFVGAGAGAPRLDGYGWSKSSSTTSLAYRTVGSGSVARWCVDGVNATGRLFRVSSNTAVDGGTCADLTPSGY